MLPFACVLLNGVSGRVTASCHPVPLAGRCVLPCLPGLTAAAARTTSFLMYGPPLTLAAWPYGMYVAHVADVVDCTLLWPVDHLVGSSGFFLPVWFRMGMPGSDGLGILP